MTHFDRKSLSRLARILLGLTGLGLVCACMPPKTEAKKDGPISVGITKVSSQPLTLTTEITGRISAIQSAEIRPQTNGIIKARLFTEGAEVKAGQSLYQIDPAPAKAGLETANAAVLQAQANFDATKAKAGRAMDLLAIKAISQQEFDDTQTAFKLATAQLAANKAALSQAQIALGYTEVRAPISGHIGASSVTAGALVATNQTQSLARIDDVSRVYLDLTQSAEQALALKQSAASKGEHGSDVTLILGNNKPYPIKGQLQFSDLSVNPQTGTVVVRALFNNPDRLLLPGLFVRARLVKAVIEDALAVPQTAINRSPKGDAFVYLAGADNRAHQTPVVLGDMVGDKWLVTSGLNPGDAVITDGLLRLKPEAPIKIAPSKPESPKSDAVKSEKPR